MRKLALLLIGGAALFGAARAQAADGVSGYVGLDLGGTWTSNDESFGTTTAHITDSAFLFGGEGRVNAWLTPNVTTQFDIEGETSTGIRTTPDTFSNTFNDGRITGVMGAHFSYRNQSFLAGGLVGFAGANNLDFDGTMEYGMVGVEGQAYLGPLTVYGQGGYLGLLHGSFDFEPANIGFIRAVGRYFFTMDDKVQWEGGFARGDVHSPPGETLSWHQNIGNWGALYEHQFSGTPFSVHVDYAGFHFDSSAPNVFTGGTTNNNANEHMILVGVKIHFGQPSLFAEDRSGATLSMPTFIRALPWAESVNAGPIFVSDRRLKRDIVQLDTLPNGLPLYAFRYIWGGPTYVGVMAQDVVRVMPAAVVVGADGFYRVNYAMVGVEMTTLGRWLAAHAARGG